MKAEELPLKKNVSFESNTSASAMVEISLSSESLNIPETIKEESFDKRPRHLKPMDLDEKLLPFLLRFLDIQDLRNCQLVSWTWFKEASIVLYGHLQFSQMSGNRLEKLLGTLQRSILSPQGKRHTQIDYASLVRYLTVKNIVFEDHTPLQSWRLVRDIIGICASTLVGLSFSIGDDSFLELPNDFVYLTSQIQLPNLKILSVGSKCMRIPNKLVLELLRAANSDSLKSIKFPRSLYNFDASGWYLICEKGGKELMQLSLTPSIGPNMLGWDEHMFYDGIKAIAESCPKIKQLDISGHGFPVPHTTLELMGKNCSQLTDLYLPCNSNDAHLLALMRQPPWKNLRTLGMSCCCVDGEMKESRKDGMSCNKFTDHVLVSFLDHLLNVNTKFVRVYLPTFLVSLKNGKRASTLDWLSNLAHVTKRDKDFLYKEKIILSVPTNRMAIFF